MEKYNGPIKEVEVVEKTVLTAEQAHEFEAFKKLRNSLEDWAHDKNDPNATYSIIHELTFDEMARAYLIGYETEPEEPKLKRCDKVVRVDGDTFAGFNFIETVEEDIGYGRYRLENGFVYTEDFIKLATPEEIYWLETLQRKSVLDIRINDVVVEDNKATKLGSNYEVSNAVGWFKGNPEKLSGIYPAESFRPFKKEPE